MSNYQNTNLQDIRYNSTQRVTKRDLIRIISLLLLSLLTLSCFFAFTACKGPGSYEINDDFKTVMEAAPTDGSLPTDHTALENIAYLNYTFSQQTSYYVQTNGVTLSAGIEQMVNAHKQFNEGVLIVVDITSSSLIKKARQYCYVGQEVMWREASSNNFDGLNTPWKTGEPSGHLTVENYKKNYGLPATEFTAYVINEETLLSATEVVVNADGTYSQTYELSTADKTGAGAYYAKQMVFAGGLDDYPQFNYINVTYTFDNNWRILRTDVDESYKAKMGITVDCVSSFNTVYEYDTDKAISSAYDDYFQQYVGQVSDDFVPTEKQPTAVGCLGEAFGSVLSGPTNLAVKLDVNGKILAGDIYLDVAALTNGGSIEDIVIRADFGKIALWLEKGQAFLYYYGIKVRFTIEELLGFVQELMGGSLSNDGSALDMDGLMASLGNGEFECVSKEYASLKSVLPLLGLEIPVQFAFVLDDENNASLKDVNAQIVIDELSVKANVSFGENTPSPLTEKQKTTFVQILPYANTVMDILNGDAVQLGLDLSIADLSICGNVNLALDSLALGLDEASVDGQIVVGYKQTSKLISFTLQQGAVHLNIDGLKVKANVSDTIDFVAGLLSAQSFGLDNAEQNGVDLTALVSVILDGSLVRNIDLTENGNVLDVVVGTSQLLPTLGLSLDSFDLGNVTLSVDNNDSLLKLSANKLALGSLGEFGVNLTAKKGEIPKTVNTCDYVDLLAIVNPVLEILSGDVIEVKLSYAVDQLAIDCNFTVNLKQLQVSANLTLVYQDIQKRATLHFDGNAIFVNFEGLKITATVDEIVDLIDHLMGDAPELSIEQSKLIEDILSLDFGQIVSISQIVTENATESVIALAGTQLLKLFGVDFELGNVVLDVEKDCINATVLGASATVQATTESVQLLSEQEKQSYLEVTPVIYKVLDIVNGKCLSLTGKVAVDMDGTQLVLDVTKANVSWANGLQIEVRAQAQVANVLMNVNLFATEQKIKVAIGKLGVELAYDEFSSLESALVAVYNNVYDLVGEMSDTEQNPLPQIDGLDDLLALLQTSVSVTQTIGAFADTGSLLTDLLSKIELSNTTNGITAKLDGLTVTITSCDGSAFELTVDGALQGICLDANFNVDLLSESLEMPNVTYLTASDFVEVFDYLNAVVNTLVQQDLTLQASIVTTSQDVAIYPDGRKQQIDVKMDFHSGDVVPLHFNLDTNSLYLSTDLYLHLTISVQDMSNVDGNDIYLDIWLYNESGKEYLQAVAQVSKFDASNEKYAPLALTASADQLMSVLSSALAIVGLDDGFVHDWIVSKWLSVETAQQLKAIGESLFETINLDQLLKDLMGENAQQPDDTTISLDELLQILLQKDEQGNYNGALSIILDGDVLFGQGANDLAVTLQKVIGENGKPLLKALSVDNVTLGEQELFVELDVSYDKVDIGGALLSDKAVCYKADGLKQLFETLAKSTTHVSTEQDVANGFAQMVGEYTLNRNFYIDGNADLKLNLASLINAQVKINIIALSVNVDKDGQVAINISLKYEHLKKLGIVAINGDTTLDVTIKGSMLYMKRTQTTDADGKTLASPEVIYRALPVASIANNTTDLLSHIGFMFNLGESVMKIINDNVKGTDTPVEKPIVDFGTDAHNVLSSYSFANGGWNVNLNGAALTGDVLTDIAISLGVDSNGLLRTLGVQTGIAVTGVDVSITANLKYRNPQNVMDEGVKDLTTDVSAILQSAMSKKIAEMESISWTDESGKALYIEGKLSTISYFVKGELVAEQYIVMDTTTQEMFADLVHPNVDVYAEKGYTLKWGEMDDSLQVSAVYTPNKYNIHFQSDISVDGWTNGNTQDAIYTYGTSFALPFAQNLSHKIAYFVDDSGNVYKTSADMQKVLADTTLTAVWEQIDYTVTYTDGNGFSQSYILHYGDQLPNVVAPQKAGYTFANWDKTGNVVGDMEILAVYTPNSYKVTLLSDYPLDGFLLANGKYQKIVDFVYDTTVALPQNVNYQNAFILNGFKMEGSNELYIYNIPNVVCDTTFVADWAEIGYNVIFQQADGTSITVNRTMGSVITIEQMPQIQPKLGYTGVWTLNGQAITDSYTVTAEDNVVIDASYVANTYTVTLHSSFAVDGFVRQGDAYVRIISYSYNENALTVEIPTPGNVACYWFGGFYTQQDGNGLQASHTTAIAQDTSYYAHWIDNTVTVRYYSDVKVAGATFDVASNGYYVERSYNDVYDVDYQPTLSGYQRLGGWWYNDGSTWQQVTNLQQFHGQTEVKLWALWIQEITVKITEFSSTKVFITLHRYNIGGEVIGGQPSAGVSRAIYDDVGIARDVAVQFYVYNDKGQGEDALEFGDSVQVNYESGSNVGTFLKQDMNCATYSGASSINPLASYGGVVMTMTFTCGTDTISTSNNAFVSKDTYTLTVKDVAGEVLQQFDGIRANCLRDASAKTLQLNVNNTLVSTLLSQVNVPQVQGHTLTGWLVNGVFMTVEQVSTLCVSGNIEMVAVYDANLYDVVFTNDVDLGGWTLNNQTGLYEFSGQMYYASQITFVLLDGTSVTENVADCKNLLDMTTFTGQARQWGKFAFNEYGFTVYELDDSDIVTLTSTVAFNYNDGANSVNQLKNVTLKYKSTYALATPTASGYTFLGWYKQQNGSYVKVDTLAYSNGQMTDTTLYALWATNLNAQLQGAERTYNWKKVNYTYTASVVVSGGALVGIDGIGASSTLTTRFWASSASGYQTGGVTSSMVGYSGSYSISMSQTTSRYNKVHAVVTLSYVINGQPFFVDDATVGDTGSEIGAYVSASV